MVAAFGTYACMYGFRKPYTAAAYAEEFAGAPLKLWLVVAQVLGYTLSKFLGIRWIAEMTRERRLRTLLALIAGAELALLALPCLPAPLGALGLFANGLCLGLVFGLVLGFVEGRRLTELFAAGLCASFIFADGFTKSIGAWLLALEVGEAWMPALAGALFAPPLLLGAWMLSRIPEPSPADLRERSPRVPLTRAERLAILSRHGLGLAGIFAAYLAITILRSVRADFAPELWGALGLGVQPSVFARSELWVALEVLAVNGALVLVREHRRALAGALALSGAALALGLGALWCLDQRRGDPFAAMVVLGFGLYVPYALVHTTLFERWIALTRERANVGFLMYLADSLGYLGYAGVMIVSLAWRERGDFLAFFVPLAVLCLVAALLGILASLRLLAPRGERVVELGAR